MSHIFDALQRSESQRSGIDYRAVTSVPTELLQAAEVLHSTQQVESESQSESRPSPCQACGSLVPIDKLFCPKCDSFQGSVATGECDDDESHSEPEHLASHDLPASWFRLSWRRLAKMQRWMAIALLAGLAFLLVLVFTTFRGRSVQPSAAPVVADRPTVSNVEISPQTPTNIDVEAEPSTTTKKETAKTDSAVTRVDGLEVVLSDNSLSVQIVTSRPLKARIKKMGNPASVVIDLPNALLATDHVRIPVQSEGVAEVRAIQDPGPPPATRIVVELTAPLSYWALRQGNKLTLNFTPPDRQPSTNNNRTPLIEYSQ